MSQVFSDKFGKLRQDIQQLRKSRSSRDEYKQRGYGQFERNQKHDVDIKETSQQRRFERDKWSTDRNQPFETKFYASISIQKPHDSKKPRPSTGVASTSKTPTCFRMEKTVHKPSMDDKHSWFSEEDKKQLLQVMQNVRNQLKRTNTARPSIEAQHQEPVTTVSDVKVAKPVSAAQSDLAASIQEVQTETSKEKEKSEERSFVMSFHVHEVNIDNSFASAYVFKEPRKLHEQKLQHFDTRWRNHTVLCFGDILVYNTFFDMITQLTCPKQDEKGTMVKEQKEEFSKNDKLLIEEFTARMSQVFNDKFGKLRQDIQQLRKSRSSRDEYKQRGYGQFERNQKHDVDIKETSQQRRFERDKWSTDRNQPFETKFYASISIQKPHDSKKPRPSTGVASTSKTPTCFRMEKTVHKPSMDDKHSWFSEEDKKQLLQVMQNVRNQLKRTNTARPSIEAQHQEPVTTVSDVKVAKPVSAAQSDLAASIQEVQTETSKEKEKSEERSFVMSFHVHEVNIDNSFASAYVFKEPRKLHEQKLQHFDTRMSQVFNDKFGKLRQDIQQLRKSRSSRDEYKQRGYGQFERNQKHDVDIKETSQQRMFERDKWSTDRNQPFETKFYASISIQKPHDSKKPRPSTGVASTSKTPACFRMEKTVHKPSMDDKHSWFSEEDKKQLLQVMQNVRNQLKRTNTARPSIEAQHQEPVTTVSDVKVAKPVSAAQSDLAASIQEVQTETSKERRNLKKEVLL
ncbi:hypothetical protein Bca52824_035280 [Brassica carinata]|uniref:Uncharacterized protein n=1 Tax=Brassica carinata TaxID=52824 RepID=A0A8X7S0C0_BRACI|nr:hypothetical protein Bca52824_035280 [Brassica carinata]